MAAMQHRRNVSAHGQTKKALEQNQADMLVWAQSLE